MANILKASQSNPVAGLGTWSHTVENAGAYKVSASSFMDPTSNLVVTISLNATLLSTSIAVQPLQAKLFVDAHVFANPGDLLTVVLSSSNQFDTIPQNVKSIISVGRI